MLNAETLLNKTEWKPSLTLSFLCSICGLRLLNSWISPLADIITSEHKHITMLFWEWLYINIHAQVIGLEKHPLLSLCILYWARSCSKSSVMASGQRAATSLMAFTLYKKEKGAKLILQEEVTSGTAATKRQHGICTSGSNRFSHHVLIHANIWHLKPEGGEGRYSPHGHDLPGVSVRHKVVGDSHDYRFDDLQKGGGETGCAGTFMLPCGPTRWILTYLWGDELVGRLGGTQENLGHI